MEPASHRTWETRLWIPDGDEGWMTYQQHQQNGQDNEFLEGPEKAALAEEDADHDGSAVKFDGDSDSTWILICSKHLIDAIRRVNKNPPLGLVPENIIQEMAPYPTLFHHLEDVRSVIEGLDNEDAREDFKALEHIVQRTAGKLWKEARSLEPGLIRYDLLWSLFHAGELVVRKDDLGNEWLLVLVEVQKIKRSKRVGRRQTQEEEETEEQLQFVTWGLIWDGTENRLTRKTATFSLGPFEGLAPVDSLTIYPLRCRRGDDAHQFQRRLAERGRVWWNLTTARATCRKYNALAYAPNPSGAGARSWASTSPTKLKLDDRVVVHRAAMDSMKWSGLGQYRKVRNEDLEVSMLDTRRDYQWDHLPAATILTDPQACLCPPLIGCDGVATKKFYVVSVEKLELVDWNLNAMKQLVLAEDKKRMLQGLISQHYLREGTKRGADIIAGKGGGLVVLLHGPPGVGKTLTAESVAQVLQKPLLALSIGDLIRDESTIQNRLETEFKRAIDWDAILLLDEADVVLEARSFEDLRRNSIVSVFLRTLEYYQGVLFLTTNRLSTMDSAFQSRIQIGIAFKSLTPDVRAEIWRKLLDVSSSNGRIKPQALDKVVLNMDYLAGFGLNGRQIRNCLNIADGYAYHEFGVEGMMEYRHIVEAVKAALEFQQLFDVSRSNLKQEHSVWAPYRDTEPDTF